MRLAISLGPVDLAGEEGLLGLAIGNLFQPGGIGEGCVVPELVALALLDEPAQLGVVVGEEEERGGRPPFLAHEQQEEWRAQSSKSAEAARYVAGSS